MRWLLINEDTVYRWQDSYYCRRNWPVIASRLLQRLPAGSALCAPVETLEGGRNPTLTELPLKPTQLVASPFAGGSVQELRGRLLGRGGRWARRLERLIEPYDVVVHRIPSPFLRYTWRACKQAAKPMVLKVSGPRVEASIGLSLVPSCFRGIALRYLRKQDREIKRMAIDAALCIVHGSQSLAAEWGHCRRVHVGSLDQCLEEDEFYRREDTCQGEVIRLIRVCDLSPPRGVGLLLEAFARVLRQDARCWLDIVGDGEHRAYVERLKELAKDLGVIHRVVFHGWCDRRRVIELMRQADLQVITSKADGIPRVLVEGAANSLPVVAVATGGIPTFVKHEISGLLVAEPSKDLVADAVIRMIRDEELRRRLIANGYALARESLAERAAARLMEWVHEAVGSWSRERPMARRTAIENRTIS